MGSNTEKKPWTNIQNTYKNLSKEIKSDNFCYRKVGRAITKWGAIEKSPMLLLLFDGSNNIFVDCICCKILLFRHLKSDLFNVQLTSHILQLAYCSFKNIYLFFSFLSSNFLFDRSACIFLYQHCSPFSFSSMPLFLVVRGKVVVI